MKAAVLFCRLLLMILGVGFGFYGVLLGMLVLVILLAEQRSFGVPYLSSMPMEEAGSAEDSVVRVPFWTMQKFGRFLAGTGGRRRLKP